MSKVFVSHSSKDAAVAMHLVHALESERIDCWIACRDVSKGGRYPGEIVKQIRESRAVVVLLTQAAFDSQNVLQEVSLACETKVMLLPIRLDSYPVPDDFTYFLTTSQWIEASADADGGLRLDTTVREVLEAVRLRPNTAALPRATSSFPVVNGEDRGRGSDSGPEAELERAALLSNEVARLAIETRKMKQVVGNLEASVAQNRELSVRLAAEEAELRDSLSSLRERRDRLGKELEEHINALRLNERVLDGLRNRYGEAAQRLRRTETTFGSGKLLMTSAAREAFFTGSNLTSLRTETARAIAFPDPPYPTEFVDVFGFLATAFGLAGARAFWESVSPPHVLGPLQRYNKALSVLFDPARSDAIQVAIGELESLRSDPTLASVGRGDIAACIMLPSLRSNRDECRLQIWTPSAEGGYGSGTLPGLPGFIDGASAALHWSQSNGVMARDWRPALLSEIPF